MASTSEKSYRVFYTPINRAYREKAIRAGLMPTFRRRHVYRTLLYTIGYIGIERERFAQYHGLFSGEITILKVKIPKGWAKRLAKGRYAMTMYIPPEDIIGWY